jgi:hypothetical protein
LFTAAGGEDEDPGERSQRHSGVPAKGEDLPFRVEVWSEDLKGVEQTLAMTANGSIGYAAYYEATREYPDRYVVLRHKTRIVARWNPPES